MSKNCEIAVTRNLRVMGLALVTVLAVLVAPSCAPLCVSANCSGGRDAGKIEAHCQQMAMHENGASVAASHRAACANAEITATLNGASAKQSLQEKRRAATATADLRRSLDIAGLIERAGPSFCTPADSWHRHVSSEIPVLRI